MTEPTRHPRPVGLRPDMGRYTGPLKALLGLGVCDCEHHSHAPDGNGHDFCVDALGIETIRTIYGTFHVCAECRASHPYPDEYLVTGDAE